MNSLGDCGYTRNDIQAILDSPIPYTKNDDKEIALVEKLVDTLTDEQMEQAAQSSYAYWIATLGDQQPTTEERRKMAKRECRRHLMKRTFKAASQDILETLKYRKERRVDLMRACFNENIQIQVDHDHTKLEKMRAFIQDDLTRQKGYIHGHDIDGRAILVVRSRELAVTDDEAFILALLYLMERAIACTESYTAGKQEKIIVVLDFGNFSSYLSPSMTAVKTVAKTLQYRYTERLHKMVIIDPPFWMRSMYTLVRPFLDPLTTAKFILAAGDQAKHDALAGLIDPDQAMPFMLPEGKLVEKVDLDKFLLETPFQLGYGEA